LRTDTIQTLGPFRPYPDTYSEPTPSRHSDTITDFMGNNNGVPVLRDEDVTALCNTSGLEEKQVRNAFTSFVEQHPDGKMKPKDFSLMMGLALPKKDAVKMEKHVFRIFDSNHDGSIDFIEFMLMFHIMDDGTPEEALEKLFCLFDVNGDGTITKREMTRLVKDMYGLIKADNPDARSEDLIAKSAFEEMDVDGDGKITLSEFVSACLSQEELSKMLALKVIDIFISDE